MFFGGELAPAPPTPPSRRLVIEEVDDKWTIVWRGEIPTVHVPRRVDSQIQSDGAIHPKSAREVQPVSRDAGRDPP